MTVDKSKIKSPHLGPISWHIVFLELFAVALSPPEAIVGHLIFRDFGRLFRNYGGRVDDVMVYAHTHTYTHTI